MRFMLVVIRKGYETAAADGAPGAEAVAKRAPMANNEIIEVRRIYERADFSIVVQKETEGFEELSNAAAAKA